MTDQEINVEISEKVMNWQVIPHATKGYRKRSVYDHVPNAETLIELPEYATSIADAFEVVDAIHERFPDARLSLYKHSDGKWRARFGTVVLSKEADSPSKAICLATLHIIEESQSFSVTDQWGKF